MYYLTNECGNYPKRYTDVRLVAFDYRQVFCYPIRVSYSAFPILPSAVRYLSLLNGSEPKRNDKILRESALSLLSGQHEHHRTDDNGSASGNQNFQPKAIRIVCIIQLPPLLHTFVMMQRAVCLSSVPRYYQYLKSLPVLLLAMTPLNDNIHILYNVVRQDELSEF